VANSVGYVYTVTVTDPKGSVTTFTDVANTQVVPSTPPLLLLTNRKGATLGIRTLEDGVKVDYEAIEIPEIALATMAPSSGSFTGRH